MWQTAPACYRTRNDVVALQPDEIGAMLLSVFRVCLLINLISSCTHMPPLSMHPSTVTVSQPCTLGRRAVAPFHMAEIFDSGVTLLKLTLLGCLLSFTLSGVPGGVYLLHPWRHGLQPPMISKLLPCSPAKDGDRFGPLLTAG